MENLSLEEKKNIIINKYCEKHYDKFTDETNIVLKSYSEKLLSYKHKSKNEYDFAFLKEYDLALVVFNNQLLFQFKKGGGSNSDSTLIFLLDDSERIQSIGSSNEVRDTEGFSFSTITYIFSIPDLLKIYNSKKIEYKIKDSFITGVLPEDAALKFKIIFFSVYNEILKKANQELGKDVFNEEEEVSFLYEKLIHIQESENSYTDEPTNKPKMKDWQSYLLFGLIFGATMILWEKCK